MVTLPFWQKKDTKTDKYILTLFLGGEKAYGYAFEERNPDNRSSLYQEHINSSLKDASGKIETIILNCERDLGDNVYLKKTVLFLNSLYTTETGAILEDFYKQIKKLVKSLDLENLGYVTFSEVIIHNFGKKEKHFYFIEESLYDYSIFEIENEVVEKTEKIAKTQTQDETLKEVKKHLKKDIKKIGFFLKKLNKSESVADQIITTNDLPELLTKIYYKDKKEISPSSTHTPVDTAHIDEQYATAAPFALAPGFSESKGISEEVPVSDQKDYTDEKLEPDKKKTFKLALPTFKSPNWSSSFLKQKRFFIIGAVIFLILLIPLYFIFLHQAEISLVTKKENFSTQTNFKVNEQSNFISKYSKPVTVKTSQQTTGEKVSGEKAKGEVTIYNGLFEEKEIVGGTIIKTGGGVSFVITEDVIIPAATTSANLNEGVETTAFGKKKVNVQAAKIGADGNIDSGIKLTVTDYSSSDLYALTAGDFNGGVKKTVRVFSNKDATNLMNKALVLAKKETVNGFNNVETERNYLFGDTFKVEKIKKNYSAEVEEEVDDVEYQLSGKGVVLFTPFAQLIDKVQSDELKDKEFVADTFQLAKVKLEKKNDSNYTYSALVKGQVQNLVDQEGILQNITGQFKWGAAKVLDKQSNIVAYTIRTKPLPLPILPFSQKAIVFKFEK